jgi:hypothetical protein
MRMKRLVTVEMIVYDLTVTRVVFRESTMLRKQMMVCNQTTHGMIPRKHVVIESEVV